MIYCYEKEKYDYKKHWHLSGESESHYTLNGTFLVNSTKQKVVSVDLSEGELIKDGENLIFYSEGILEGNEKTIYANAIVETNYDPFLSQNPSLGNVPHPDSSMHEQAQELTGSSVAETVVAFTDWIHNNIKYDLDASDITDPEEVFIKREGVCTAYSNLLVAFLDYAEIESRGITGYAESEMWRPHAWVEVKIGGEWIAVDPTYNQIGVLSNHVKSRVNFNGDKASDTISSAGGLTDFSYDVDINRFYSEDLGTPVSYSYEIYNNSVKVFISNPTNSHVFVPYYFYFSEGWGESTDKIILLSPDEKITIVHEIIPSEETSVNEGYIYHIEFEFSVMGDSVKGTVDYTKEEPQNGAPACLSGFIIFLGAVSIWKSM